MNLSEGAFKSRIPAFEQRREEVFNAIDDGNILLLTSMFKEDARFVMFNKIDVSGSEQILHCLNALFEIFRLEPSFYNLIFQISEKVITELGSFYCSLISKITREASNIGGEYRTVWYLDDRNGIWKIKRFSLFID